MHFLQNLCFQSFLRYLDSAERTRLLSANHRESSRYCQGCYMQFLPNLCFRSLWLPLMPTRSNIVLLYNHRVSKLHLQGEDCARNPLRGKCCRVAHVYFYLHRMTKNSKKKECFILCKISYISVL